MKNLLPATVGALVVVMLLSFMFLYQVRYDQAAVLTTFDRADAPTYDQDGQVADRGSLRTEPGLYVKLPWPIQKVTHYSTRLQLHEDRLEQLSTTDGKTVAVRAFLTWRITDPVAFFVKLQDLESAQEKIDPLLSEQISGTIGRYRMDQLVNNDPGELKLEQIENEALAGITERLNKLGYGIEVTQVGLRRLLLPQESTAKVFETMRQTRERLASITRSSGDAQATTIKSEAEAARKRILAFAERRAQGIRALGDKEAAQYYSAFSQDESLAIFLRRIEALKLVLPHNTTFVLDANQLSLDELFRSQGADSKAGVID